MPSILNLQTNPLFLENIESLHIRLAKELADINGKTLIFTSTVAKEGKSTIATNVAYALAKNNKKVLLIDADLRKQDLSKQMNLTTNGVGLSSIKYGSDVVEDAIVYLEKQNLYF
ncbi:AAA family ATPase [Coprobacillaceae bacterium CR2/5/TPMF4]|nr:AAA family ATPase [Coprobacillaceae bacterium CR2/5/TPMF4]